jgi:hypothetical protein
LKEGPIIHLIFSNIITEKRLWNNKDVKKGDERNRPSMTASTLRSLDGLGIESADFYLEFDESTCWSKSTLLQLIETLPFKSRVFGFRLDSFARWAEASRELDSVHSDQIMLFTNEDHVRFSPDISEYEYSTNLLSELQRKHPTFIMMLPLSHFPESHAMIPISEITGTGMRVNGVPLIPSQIPAGPIVLGKRQFEDLWRDDFTAGMPIVGLENPRGRSLRLPNGYYLPPRKELFRHLDSYGHIRVNNWPFNTLNPNVSIYQASPLDESIEKYHLTTELRSPPGNTSLIVAAEEPGDSSQISMRMSILKSSFIRPSWSSLRWVSSAYPYGKVVAIKEFLFVMISHPEFAARALLSLVAWPIHLSLAVLGVFIKPSSRLRIHYVWFLTYGSSIGYVRLALLSLTKKIAARHSARS